MRVTPRASREGVEGLVDTGDGRVALAVRVRAAPTDGEANKAVARILAKTLSLPIRAVNLHSGATARLKQFYLDGPAALLSAQLAEIVKDKTP